VPVRGSKDYIHPDCVQDWQAACSANHVMDVMTGKFCSKYENKIANLKIYANISKCCNPFEQNNRKGVTG